MFWESIKLDAQNHCFLSIRALYKVSERALSFVSGLSHLQNFLTRVIQFIIDQIDVIASVAPKGMSIMGGIWTSCDQ